MATTITDLAKDIGIGRRSVWYWVDKLGIGGDRIGSMGMVVLSDEEVDLIKQSVRKGKEDPGVSISDLVDELGMTKQNIWRIVRRIGIRESVPKGIGVRFTDIEADQIRNAARRA